jgi:broad specificity phosphatase PhoE
MTAHLVLATPAPTAATRTRSFPDDGPLDDPGRAQAAAAVGLLQQIDHVYCGPELRCVQTADALGGQAVADPVVEFGTCETLPAQHRGHRDIDRTAP